MDYIRIKTTRLQDYKTTSRDVTPVASENVAESPSHQVLVTEPVDVPMAHSSQLTAKEVKNLLKDWIKLYPNSFAPDVEFKVYQLVDGDIIIQLHEDLSSMAVSLLVLYFETTVNRQQSTDILHNSATQQLSNLEAYITIDDTEVLLKQNEGKRAMVFCSRKDAESQSHRELVAESKVNGQQSKVNGQQTLGKSRDVTPVASENKMSDVASVRFILEDNYALDYNFEKRAQPVKDCDMVFEEPEFSLPEEYESVRVGDVVKKKIDEILDEGLTPKKLMMYLLCGAIGLSIGFLIVYFMSK